MAKSNRRHPPPFVVKLTEGPDLPDAIRAFLAGKRYSPRQELALGAFRHWMEMEGSLARLQLASKFLGRLRPRSANADAIGYHVEKHLEEIYILQQRVDRFLTLLERRLKKRRLTGEAQKVSGIRLAFNKTLERVVEPRHGHVHKERFRDLDIGQLEMLDSVRKIGGTIDLKTQREPLARATLQKWRGLLETRHAELSGIVDGVFQDLDRIGFEKLSSPARE
jgi:hypothetical protein